MLQHDTVLLSWAPLFLQALLACAVSHGPLPPDTLTHCPRIKHAAAMWEHLLKFCYCCIHFLQAVLACDVERTDLLKEEAELLAKLPKVCACTCNFTHLRHCATLRPLHQHCYSHVCNATAVVANH
jgi:hypothetical protein